MPCEYLVAESGGQTECTLQRVAAMFADFLFGWLAGSLLLAFDLLYDVVELVLLLWAQCRKVDQAQQKGSIPVTDEFPFKCFVYECVV
jgi:hypothetical protein